MVRHAVAAVLFLLSTSQGQLDIPLEFAAPALKLLRNYESTTETASLARADRTRSRFGAPREVHANAGTKRRTPYTHTPEAICDRSREATVVTFDLGGSGLKMMVWAYDPKGKVLRSRSPTANLAEINLGRVPKGQGGSAAKWLQDNLRSRPLGGRPLFLNDWNLVKSGIFAGSQPVSPTSSCVLVGFSNGNLDKAFSNKQEARQFATTEDAFGLRNGVVIPDAVAHSMGNAHAAYKAGYLRHVGEILWSYALGTGIAGIEARALDSGEGGKMMPPIDAATSVCWTDRGCMFSGKSRSVKFSLHRGNHAGISFSLSTGRETMGLMGGSAWLQPAEMWTREQRSSAWQAFASDGFAPYIKEAVGGLPNVEEFNGKARITIVLSGGQTTYSNIDVKTRRAVSDLINTLDASKRVEIMRGYRHAAHVGAALQQLSVVFGINHHDISLSQ